jgi:hypothetical protein
MYGSYAARGNFRVTTASCSNAASIISRSCRFIFLDWPCAEPNDTDLPRRQYIWMSTSAAAEGFSCGTRSGCLYSIGRGRAEFRIPLFIDTVLLNVVCVDMVVMVAWETNTKFFLKSEASEHCDLRADSSPIQIQRQVFVLEAGVGIKLANRILPEVISGHDAPAHNVQYRYVHWHFTNANS